MELFVFRFNRCILHNYGAMIIAAYNFHLIERYV